MCCNTHRFAVRIATHYHIRARQTLKHGKEYPEKETRLQLKNTVTVLTKIKKGHDGF